jgi:hypothetical protein
MDTGHCMGLPAMAMAVQEQIDLVCIPKCPIMFLGCRQQWHSRYHHCETARHNARDTDAHWENVCLPPGYAMGSWSAVMEVMRRAVGDTYACTCMSHHTNY